MASHNESYGPFPIGETAKEKGSYVPDRACPDKKLACVPLVDLVGLCEPSRRSILVEEIRYACQHYGFFQAINHGIPEPILNEAISVATNFFSLPTQDKARYMSNNVCEPVRYCTSIKDGMDQDQYRRIFLKHYANPLQDWIHLWPDNPPDYRKKMGEYAKAVQKLSMKIMGVITESLGLGPSYLSTKLQEGMQVMAVNCYPPCPEPDLSFGLPPHSDYSCLTILHQDSFGLEILGFEDETWKGIPLIPGALQVHVGDHLEVLSNGRYKSVVHRATLNSDSQRISIASLHSRSASSSRFADDNFSYYASSPSSKVPTALKSLSQGADELPRYEPLSEAAKKEKSRVKFAEGAVHLIPLILLLCAFILWVASNPDIDVRGSSIAAEVEGIPGEGHLDSDGTGHLPMDLGDMDPAKNIFSQNRS